jgi:GH35 family endo-1,4-beta-xylanase
MASGTTADGVLPRMNIVIADTKAEFDVTPGLKLYQHTFNLPAGTYFVRTEFNNDLELSIRDLLIKDLSFEFAPKPAPMMGMVGSTQMISSPENALAAADTYIENFRKGNVTIEVPDAAAGTPVQVSLKRHAFNFGTAVPGFGPVGVNNYLGSDGTQQQVNYQARLNANFNAIVPENAGKWASNESVRDGVSVGSVDAILDYAAAHNMRARMHNLIWGDNSNNGQQPPWVLNDNDPPNDGLLDQIFGENATMADAAAAELREEITERIGYYVGSGTPADRARKYVELDVYNESFHTGPGADSEEFPHNYWNAYGADGIAAIYNEVKQAVSATGASTKLFVNEFGALGDPDYANFFVKHIEDLRRAASAAELEDVVGGIGVQYYPNDEASHAPQLIMQNLQNLAVQGLPTAITEFGVRELILEDEATPEEMLAASEAVARVLDESLRLAFGTAESTGFFMWGFHAEDGGANLFAPAAALYNVDTSDWTNWTLTEAGKVWRDRLGIEDFDANATNGWTTELTAEVDAEGNINFDGFWGDYEFMVNGQTIELTLVKGRTQYSLAPGPELPGDYNVDGIVDAADFTVWRDSLGRSVDFFEGADGDGDGSITIADYDLWKANFGQTTPMGVGSAAAVPEPTSAVFALLCSIALAALGRGTRCPAARQAFV